jgi:hypothetical protein
MHPVTLILILSEADGENPRSSAATSNIRQLFY